MTALPSSAGPAEVFSRFDVSRESQVRLQAYVTLLERWQARINLVGPETMARVWQRHVADGLQLIRFIGANPRTLIDIGSGGGIPGLVLALAYPQLRVVLVESNQKKAAFLREASRPVAERVFVIPHRLEKIDSEPYRMAAPIVTARAVAHLKDLLDLTEPLLRWGIGLFYKGQTVDDELTDSADYWRIRFVKHRSIVEPRGSILEILEARRSHDDSG